MKPRFKHTFEFEALGVPWWVQLDEATVDQQAIQSIVNAIDNRWSRFRSDSMVADMAKHPGDYRLENDEHHLLSFYRSLYEVTSGKVTPFIAEALEDLGYDALYSFKERPHRYRSKAWDDVLDLRDQTLTLKQPMLLDIGAAGKGYAVDRVAAAMNGDFIVDASGDMFVQGTTTIGLQDPSDRSKVIGQVELTNQAICGSSIYVRAWNGYHHVLDGQTGEPTKAVIATWAMADSAMVADGLATALFFVEPTVLHKLGLTDYCVVYADMSIVVHPQTKVQLFIA